MISGYWTPILPMVDDLFTSQLSDYSLFGPMEFTAIALKVQILFNCRVINLWPVVIIYQMLFWVSVIFVKSEREGRIFPRGGVLMGTPPGTTVHQGSSNTCKWYFVFKIRATRGSSVLMIMFLKRWKKDLAFIKIICGLSPTDSAD